MTVLALVVALVALALAGVAIWVARFTLHVADDAWCQVWNEIAEVWREMPREGQ